MSDYIERQVAIEAIQQAIIKEYDRNYGVIDSDIVYEILDDLPAADVVPVVRCKDCKQFRRWVNTDIDFCDLTESTVFGDDFCSRGERWE